MRVCRNKLSLFLPREYCVLTFTPSAESSQSPDSEEFRHQPGADYYDPDIAGANGEFDELGVVCPSHTTERRLMAKIDMRVIPVLSILYLLAFLDRCVI